MSLNAVFDALSGYLSGGSIDLYAASQGEPETLAGLAQVLDHYAIRGAFELTAATLVPPGTSVKLGGKGNYGLAVGQAGAAITAALDITDNAGEMTFVLRFDFGAARIGFSSLFPNLLPDYEQLQPNQSVEFKPSFLYDLGIRVLRLQASNDVNTSVSASGLLDAEGVLTKYKSLFPGWPLTITGRIDMPRAGVADDVVAMDLTAIDKRVQIPFYSNQLKDVGLSLSSVRDLDINVNLVGSLSSLELIGSLTFSTYAPVRLSMPLTASGGTWRLIAELPSGFATIGNAISALAGLLGLQPDDLLRPIDFIGLDAFYLSTIEVAFAPPAGALPRAEVPQAMASALFTPTLKWLAITVRSVRSDKAWTPPLPFVSVDRVGARWLVTWPGGTSGSVWGGSVFGGLSLGDSNETDPTGKPVLFTLDVTALLPQFIVKGRLRQALTLPIGTALKRYVGEGTPDTPAGMSLSTFWFSADPNQRTFRAEAEIDMDWQLSPLSNVVFDLVGMSFFVDVQQSSVSGGLSASIRLDDQPTANGLFPTLTVSAKGERAQGKTAWTFEGGLLPGAPLSLTRMAKRLIGVSTDGWSNFPKISIDTLNFAVQTGAAGFYSAAGSASLLWSPTILDTEVRIAVSAGASVTKPTGGTAAGTVTGSFALNRLAMTLGFDFGVPNPTWRFRVQFGQPWIELTTFTTTDVPAHRILTAQLGGVTLGSIIEYLVNLAAPTLGYRLDPPWDALNRVDLSRFLLSLDLTTSTVTLAMNLPIDLGVMQITQLGLKYTRGAGLSGVELTLAGKFFGQDKKLGWDVIKDPPPAVPGQGASLVNLYYLALGQRVRPQDQSPKTVRAFLDSMEKAMQPLPPGGSTPPPIGNGVEFAADSEWLIGLDIDIAETFRLGLLFNDPTIYGLSIALRGSKSGSFDGLDFQLLYKKISDSIGMFRIDLALPLAMRSFTIGVVGITLGNIALEIYTNGNFTVDFGFPWKRDFSRSFTLQYFPFIGRGGIYFGYLNGATSSRVPKITDGTFDPVIELGVGLAVGVGSEVVFGPLSGGAYVQIEVIFLGVFGWFNPTDHGRKPAVYFWAQATAAIVGKVYGTVDFKVIKVSISLMIEAEAMVTFEVYRAALFHVAVRVTAEAEIKILFIKISFSFKVSLAFDFTAGSDQATPWTLASNQGTYQSLRTRGNRLPALRRSQQRRIAALAQFQRRMLQARGVLRAQGAYWLDFDPKAAIFASQKTLVLNLIPAFSLTDLPIAWNAAAPTNADPAWRIALLLTAETGVDPAAVTPKMREKRSAANCLHADDETGQPAHLLAEALLRWAIYAVVTPDGQSNSGNVSAAQLAQMADQLDLPEAANDAFSIKNLSAFFEHSLLWQIAGDPGGGGIAIDAMLLPLPPKLTLKWDKPVAGTRDLATWQAIGERYISDVAAYQQDFQPMSKKGAAGNVDRAQDEVLEAFASHAFRDFCLMLTKAVVKTARDQLEQSPVKIEAPASLAEIAARFPTATVDYRVQGGDTLAQVAMSVGATAEELLALDPNLPATLAAAQPGTILPISIGIAPAMIALDNPDAALTAGQRTLGTVHATVREGDSFSSIATRFGISAATLATVAVIDDLKLLGADRLIASVAVPYTFAADVSPGLGAGIFFARWFGTAQVIEADWYAQTLSLWNATALSGIDPAGCIPAGLALKVPVAFNDTQIPAGANYITLAGDTSLRIGAALGLLQLYSVGGSGSSPPPNWPAFRDVVTQNGRSISLPAAQIPVEPGESARTLGLRTLLKTSGSDVDGSALLTWLGTSPVLSPMSLIEISSAMVDTGVLASFSAIASAMGLSLVEIGAALANVSGLLAASAETPVELSVSAVPVQAIETLVRDSLAGRSVADLAGQMSRQTLSGLRLPAPQTNHDGIVVATGPMTAFVELTGQQIVGPPPGDDVGAGTGINLDVSANGDAPWITLVDSTITRGESISTLQEHYPAAAKLNLALRARHGEKAVLPAGLILRTGIIEQLNFSYSAADLKARYPVPSLSLAPVEGPVAIPLSALAPESFGLDHEIILQTAQKLALPGAQSALTGQPQLYPFPNGLRLLAHGGTARSFEVVASKPGDSVRGESSILPDATFAANVRVRIQRSSVDPPVYTLIGSDAGGREVLLDLVANLGAGAVAYLAVSPDPAAPDTNGLTIVDLATPQAAFLVRTNLSTASVPDEVSLSRSRLQARKADADLPLNAADLSNPAQFAQLLFEGSVVGGSGYFLSVTARDGSALPASAFDNDGRAELSFLVISAAAQQPAPNGRALETFVNCTLLGAGIDPSSQSLSVIDTDDTLGNHVATVPPGNAGFRVVLPNPRTDANALPTDIEPTPTAQLFGLVDYTLGGTGQSFDAKLPGLPIYPRSPDDPTWLEQRRLRRQRLRGEKAAVEVTSPDWLFEVVVPVSRFAGASAAPAVAGLPDPVSDPYRGLGAAVSRPDANFAVGMRDALGNASADANAYALQVSIGYTDPLIGPDGWPSTRLSYLVSDAAPNGQLSIRLDSLPANLWPAIGEDLLSARARAQQQCERYQAIYYQWSQPGLGLQADSSLFASAGAQTLSNGPAAMWQLAAAQYLSANVLGSAVSVNPAATQAQQLGPLAASFGFTLDHFAAANASVLARAVLLDQAVPMPAYVVMQENDSADVIATRTPPGVIAPTPEALLNLDANSQRLPLRAGAWLVTDARQETVEAADPTPSIAHYAALLGSSAGQLALDNADVQMLRSGFVFDIDQVPLTVNYVTEDGSVVRSFNEAVAAYLVLGVHIEADQLAENVRDADNLLSVGAVLHSTHYQVPAPSPTHPFETLSVNGSGSTPERLAKLNTGARNLFDRGAMIYVGDFEQLQSVDADDLATFEQWTQRFGTTPTQLLQRMDQASAAIPANSSLCVPGLLALAANTQRRIGAVVPESLQPQLLVARFDYGAAVADAMVQFVNDQLAMPRLLASGVTVAVNFGGNPYSTSTEANDTFGRVLARLQGQATGIDVASLAAGVAANAQLLRVGAAIIVPVAILDANCSSATAALRYGVAVDALAAANIGLRGLFLPHCDLYAPSDSSVKVATVIDDSWNAILSRFADAGITDDLSAIVIFNRDVDVYSKAAQLLLPGPPVVFTLPLNASSFAQPIFALDVTLISTRPSELIDANFADTAVQRTRSVAQPATGDADADSRERLSTDLRAAMPSLRLASGRSPDTEANLWMVDFGSSGISMVDVSAGAPGVSGDKWPRFYALRPLYASLISRTGIHVPVVNNDGTISDSPNASDFVGVDVETWARAYLADVDRLLAGSVATEMYRDVTQRPALDRLLAAKRLLVGAGTDSGVAAGLAPVLSLQSSVDASARANAVSALSQALGSSLSSAYASVGVVQYDTKVDSYWTRNPGGPGARLFGDGIPDSASPVSYTLTSTRVDLAAPTSTAEFILGLDRPSEHKSIAFSPSMVPTHLEWNIRALPLDGNAGYVSSNWLTFIPALTAAVAPTSLHIDLGESTAPIPLRAFPSLPSVQAQSGGASFPDGGTLNQLSQWTYEFSYRHEHAAQDELIVNLQFNLTQLASRARLESGLDVATSLARYQSAAPTLFGLLDGLGHDTTAANAANSLAALVLECAQAWSGHFAANAMQARRAANIAASSFWLDVQLIYSGDGTSIVAIDVTRLADPDQPGNGPTAPGPNDAWPDLHYRAPDGLDYALTGADVVPSALTRRYIFNGDAPPSAEWAQVGLRYPNLQIADWQNATGGVAVVRNRALIDGAQTNLDFVYASARVQAADVTTPLLQWTQAVEIGQGPNPITGLVAALEQLFGQSPNGQPLSLAIGYGYELTPGLSSGSGLRTVIPVNLLPRTEWSVTLATDLADVIAEWQNRYQPATTGGLYQFGLTLYSSQAPQTSPPLLTVEQVIWRV